MFEGATKTRVQVLQSHTMPELTLPHLSEQATQLQKKKLETTLPF